VYRLHGLARGTHTLVLTKRSGAFLAIDAFTILE
jgi:hypothetical protein